MINKLKQFSPKLLKHHAAKLKPYYNPYSTITTLIFVVIFATIGIHLLLPSHAAPINTLTSSSIAPATNLQVIDSTPTQVYLTWTASTDANVTGYAIYNGATQVGTSQALTTSYLATNLTPGTTYSYSVYAQVSGTSGPASNTVSGNTTTAATIPITTCTTITSPGNYVLSQTLSDNTSSYCINIENTSNVSLDCQNNTINILNSNPAINMNNTSNFLIDNCNIILGKQNSDATAINIGGSTDGAIESNTIGNSQGIVNQEELDVAASENTSLSFNNNTIYNGELDTAIIVNSSFPDQTFTRSSINGNSIGCGQTNTDGGTICSDELLLMGSSNTVAYNNLNGYGWANSDQPSQQWGTDDGIVLGNNGITSQSNLIEYNNITNDFDMGIETIGINNYDTISNNTISNAFNGGIGGWFWNSWLGNTIADNTVSNSSTMFYVFINRGLPNGQSDIYFENNSFSGNTYIPDTLKGGEGANINLFYQPEGSVPANEIIASGDTFTDNNFSTKVTGPQFNPSSMIVDGGGNVCQPTYALKCVKPILPTAPTNLTAASNGSDGVFLSWTASSDPGGPGVAGYNIFRNGVQINSKKILDTITNYTDTTIKQGPKYSYYVKAVDTLGNSSKPSSKVTYQSK